LKSEPQSHGEKLLATWEYAVELLLAALLSLLAFLLFGRETLHKNLCSLRGDLTVSFEVLLGTAVAVWVGFLAMLATSFGRWLRRKKEAYAYAVGLAAPAFIYFFALMVLVFTICSEGRAFVVLNVCILIYGLINFITMIRNINGLVGLWQVWEARPRSRG
jgi:hypothetical protein